MEWKTVKLGEVITIKYGKDHKALGAGSIPVYGSGGIMRYADKAICDKPSILIPRKGSLNNIFYVNKPFWTVDTMFWSIIDTEKADPHFLFYAICKLDFAGLNVGSAVPSLTVPVIEAVELALPPLETQRRIAAILSSLDDKIENNNRINRNLEEQAQALFKSWFVDFEPWGGIMPEDWKEGTLGDIIAEIESGSRPKGGAQTSGVPSIGAEKIERFGIYDFSGEKYVSEEFFNKMKRGHVNDGDVMLYKDGAYTGKCSMALDGFPYKECAVNEHVFLLRTEEAKYQFYLYLNMIQESVRSMIYTLACSKAAQPGLNTSEVLGVKTIIPTEAVMMDFNSKVANMMHTIANNCLESHRLATIRDTLLPKLMRGEISL